MTSIPAPTHLCLTCRSLLDRALCGCPEREARVVDLGVDDEAQAERARVAIEEAVLVEPERDRGDMMARLFIGLLVGPALVALLFGVMFLFLIPLMPELATFWPWVFGAPLVLVTLLWSAFVVHSTLRSPARRVAVPHLERPRTEGVEARVARGSEVLAFTVWSSHRRDEGVIVRDAWAREPLVLLRPGERIEVPAGRLSVIVDGGTWDGAEALRRSWASAVPAALKNGTWRGVELREGADVTLHGGTLEEDERVDVGFRAAADRRFRWVGERPILVVR